MLRRIRAVALHALVLGLAPPARAGLDLDLSSVDLGSPARARFHDRVDPSFAAGGTLTVHDQFVVANGVEAVWQLNVPLEPQLEGDTIRMHGLEIVPVLPASPTISFVEWTRTGDDDFLSGWKIELRGGASEYLVELRPALFTDGFESGGARGWSGSVP